MDALSVIEEMPIEVQITCALALFMFLSGVFSGILMERRLFCQHKELERLFRRMEGGGNADSNGQSLRKLLVEDWVDGFDQEDISMDEVANALLQRPEEERSFIEERVRVMSSAVRESNEGSMLPPLEDLEQLTREKETSRRSYLTLRGVSSIMLMLGICGTLWSVEGLNYKGGNEELAKCLVPSMICIVVYIVFVVWRGKLIGQFEGLMKRLDEFTMCYLIPAMQPKSVDLEEERQFREFTERLHEYERRFADASTSFEVDTHDMEILMSGLRERENAMACAEEIVSVFMGKWKNLVTKKLSHLKMFSLLQSEVGIGCATVCMHLQCLAVGMQGFVQAGSHVQGMIHQLNRWKQTMSQSNAVELCEKVKKHYDEIKDIIEKIVSSQVWSHSVQSDFLHQVNNLLGNIIVKWRTHIGGSSEFIREFREALDMWRQKLYVSIFNMQLSSESIDKACEQTSSLSRVISEARMIGETVKLFPMARWTSKRRRFFKYIRVGSLIACSSFCIYMFFFPINHVSCYTRLLAKMGNDDAVFACATGSLQFAKMKELRSLFQHDPARAQFRLGECYYYGKGVSRNRAEAVKWYSRAAEQGYAPAQVKLREQRF